ncbi:hypothetical protein AB0B07_23185 [Streptomyces sioyaensis]|uniref:hypothetical protein n=1 Tax=Streptomyces sioyaensis TaxID=67364 RepID=UPI0033DC35F6
MSTEALRAVLQDRWMVLEKERTTEERRLRATGISTATANGPAVATDREGHRHLGGRPGIHGLIQLETREDGAFGLSWLGLERTNEGGTGIGGPVRRQSDHESALLGEVGCAHSRNAQYHDVRFVTTEERRYNVDADFPKPIGRNLTSACLSVSALNVEYRVDLSVEQLVLATTSAVEDTLRSLIEESA